MRLSAALVLVDACVREGAGGQQHVGHAVAGEIPNEHQPFFALPVVRLAHGQPGHAAALAVVQEAGLSHDHLGEPVARPVQQAVMPGIVSHDAGPHRAVLVNHPEGTLPPRLMVNVHGELNAARLGTDPADVHRLEVLPGQFPDQPPVPIHERNRVRAGVPRCPARSLGI